MENYIVINGVTYDLVARPNAAGGGESEGAASAAVGRCQGAPSTQTDAGHRNRERKLSDVSVGKTCMIGSHEMIVLDHHDTGVTLLLRKDALEKMRFGENNNYDGSAVDRVCNEFAGEIAEIVGEDNIILHEVDLTADDGLKDYGKVSRKASLRTANLQRKYVEILDKYRLDVWEWLATAFSTPTHDPDNWVKCVSPAGCFDDNDCDYDYDAVRPFCILKSDIFVSN